MVYLQIQKQEASSLRLQAQGQRSHKKAEIYEKIADILGEWAHAAGRAHTLVRSTISALESNLAGLPSANLSAANEISDAHHRAARATSNVLIFLERYEIVFLYFTDAHRRVGDAHTALTESFLSLYTLIVQLLPLQHPTEPGRMTGPLRQATPDDLDNLRALAEHYYNACGDLQGYALDLGVEAQNELLGDLFQRVVPPRRPQDPSIKVLKRSEHPLSERPEGRWS